MFITIQFPLFDNRFLTKDPTRNEKPDWRQLDTKASIRYFGQIIDRDKEYFGPWDDEKKYIRARRVFNLCGVKKGHYYTELYNTNIQSRIVFRRFQSDGKCMAKFEIGFNDSFEETIRAANLPPTESRAQLIKHIQKYLNIPVEIKVGNRLSKFKDLIDSGQNLAAAYYWATTVVPRSFNNKEIDDKVKEFDPLMLIHVDRSSVDLNDFASDKVDMPELESLGIGVYRLMIPYYIGRNRFQVKTWLIATNKSISTNPIMPGDFQYFKPAIRNLRINLLRINIETLLQRRLTSQIIDAEGRELITDPELKESVFHYLHKIYFNLSKLNRNNQKQEQLADAVFKLDDIFNGTENLARRIDGLRFFITWLNSNPAEDDNPYLKEYVIKTEKKLSDTQDELTGRKSVFISYNHHDRATANLLRDALKKKGIKVILDSDDMLAGTRIEDFINESIKASRTTLLIASEYSLKSGWVGIEIMNTTDFQKYSAGKKLLASYVDERFMDSNFVNSCIDKFDADLDEIEAELILRKKKGATTPDIDARKERLTMLRKNIPSIVALLLDQLSIDVRKENFEAGVEKLLLAV